jgi:hypothetical protein
VQPEAFFFFSSELPISVPRSMKNCLPSWRHSADTGANARRSKVIGRRIYDAEIRGVLPHLRRLNVIGSSAGASPPTEVHKF